MRLALIPPLSYLDVLEATDYQMALPYLDGKSAITYPEYVQAYKQARDRDDFVILDNGAAENTPAAWHELLYLAETIGASEVVLPDAVGDTETTKLMAEQAWEDRDPHRSYMYVIQGSTLQEVLESIEHAYGLCVDTIGIPRHLNKTLNKFSARVDLIDYLNGFAPPMPIHLLGTDRAWLQEIKYIRRADTFNRVRGVDTSAPFCYVGQYSDLAEDVLDRPPNYFTSGWLPRDDNVVGTKIWRNISRMLNWAEETP